MRLAGVSGFGQPGAGVWLSVPTTGAGSRNIAGMKKPTSVLIVDDHPSFRRSARRMLEASGYLVAGEAVDGASALAAARRLDPDLILLDVQLPDLDGFEVAERLRRDGCDAQIVLTSSRDSSEFGEAIANGPARGFIAKAELSGAGLAELTG